MSFMPLFPTNERKPGEDNLQNLSNNLNKELHDQVFLVSYINERGINYDIEKILDAVRKKSQEYLDRYRAQSKVNQAESHSPQNVPSNEQLHLNSQKYAITTEHPPGALPTDLKQILFCLFRQVYREGPEAGEELRSWMGIFAGNNEKSVETIAKGILRDLQFGRRFLALDPPQPEESLLLPPSILIRSRLGLGYRCGDSTCTKFKSRWRLRQIVHAHLSIKYCMDSPVWVCPIWYMTLLLFSEKYLLNLAVASGGRLREDT
jgi:hypothetical protein